MIIHFSHHSFYYNNIYKNKKLLFYSTFKSLALGLGCSFALIFNSNIPFVYVALVKVSSNSTSNGILERYFLSPCSALIVTLCSEILTLISSLDTPGISAVTIYVFSFSLKLVSTNGSLISLFSTNPLIAGRTFLNLNVSFHIVITLHYVMHITLYKYF